MGKMYSVRAVAKEFGVTTYTVRNWARDGKIKAFKIPNNSDKAQWFFAEEEINRLKSGESGESGESSNEKQG